MDEYTKKIIQERKENIRRIYEQREKHRQEIFGKKPKSIVHNPAPTILNEKIPIIEPIPENIKPKSVDKVVPREKIQYNTSRNRWKGETVCVIASGPSLTREDCDEVYKRGWKTIVINDTYKMALFADAMYACDGTWWNVHHQGVKDNYYGETWTQDKPASEKYGLNYVQSVNRPGLGTGEMIHQGANSGYQCINLAYYWGAKRIILLGLDCSPSPDGKKHWFGDHPKGLSNNQPFERWVLNFKKLADDLALLKIDVINASRRTALGCFKQIFLEDIDK